MDHSDSKKESISTNKLLEAFDTDKDGKLSYHEFIQGAVNHQKLLNKKNVESLFKMLDLDQSKAISINELEKVFSNKPDQRGRR